ncbi:Ankyrin repeat-containing domain protein [Ascosphaera apis ARSEF 7405]|uniref:Ankyrin repeat-containing domain protein n=1 Tax=Ascosphaera apis ARSEF 7405 TaxID=392613 RepID=A0A167WB94_9EURO|nr:Ankyrin repeat-containing domain protein [Ascosphaera apis ARSEF 7405]
MGDRPAISVATRLRSAIITNDLLLVKRILRNNPTYLQNPNFDDNGNTSLHLAAIMGHLEIIKYLVEQGHDSSDPREIDSDKVESLTAAAAPDISVNGDLETALHLAAKHSHPSCVQYLCEVFPQTLDKRDCEGATPLMRATRSANCRTYVPHSTNLLPPKQLPTSRYVPNHGASGIAAIAAAATAAAAAASAAAEDTTTISILLQHGADVNAIDNEWNSALHQACAWGNLRSFRLLLGAGAKPNSINCHGFVPLDYAVSMSAFKYCRALIREFDVQQQRLHQPPTAQSQPQPQSQSQSQSQSQTRSNSQAHTHNQNSKANSNLRPQLQRTPTLPTPQPKQQRSTPKLRLQTSTTDLTLGSSASNTPMPIRSSSRSPMSRFRPSFPRGAVSASSVKVPSPRESSMDLTADPASAVI